MKSLTTYLKENTLMESNQTDGEIIFDALLKSKEAIDIILQKHISVYDFVEMMHSLIDIIFNDVTVEKSLLLKITDKDKSSIKVNKNRFFATYKIWSYMLANWNYIKANI